jgi:hypothetical protein
MTSIPKRRAHKLNQPAIDIPSSFGAKQICLIVGLACLAGFGVDILAIGLPPNPFDLQWRVGFLQQLGDRSIILLFGSALLLYSQLGNRRLTKPLSLIFLGVGVAFMLSCILVIRDGLILQNQAADNIALQAQQLQTQIEASKSRPDLPAAITSEQFIQAEQQVTSQADQLRQTARTGITKVGLASMGNLIIAGLGLVGLGRFGLTGAQRFNRG